MTDQTTTAPETCDFAALSAPTDAHAALKPFAGTFKAEVQMWMGPGEPMQSTGTMTNTVDLGGRYLQQVYKGDPCPNSPFPEFEGRGYWGYNKTDERYEGFWIDSASTQMQFEQGQVNGKVWTMTGEMTCGMSGEARAKRSVITLVDDNHHSIEMFFAGPDGNEMKAMEIQYTRA